MRDESILQMRDADVKRVAAIYRQLQFVYTRLEAYEKVLSSQWAFLRSMWNPKWLQKSVDAMQLELLRKHDETLKQAQMEAKEKVSKPKIQVVSPMVGIKTVIAAVFLFSGCVPASYHKAKVQAAYNDGYNAADKECLALQARIAGYVDRLKERLRKYDQLDEKGNLKPLKKWTGDTWEDDVNPDAPWMK